MYTFKSYSNRYEILGPIVDGNREVLALVFSGLDARLITESINRSLFKKAIRPTDRILKIEKKLAKKYGETALLQVVNYLMLHDSYSKDNLKKMLKENFDDQSEGTGTL